MNSNRNFDEKKMKRFNQDIKKVLFLLFFSFLDHSAKMIPPVALK